MAHSSLPTVQSWRSSLGDDSPVRREITRRQGQISKDFAPKCGPLTIVLLRLGGRSRSGPPELQWGSSITALVLASAERPGMSAPQQESTAGFGHGGASADGVLTPSGLS
jgi:hypothetical protein